MLIRLCKLPYVYCPVCGRPATLTGNEIACCEEHRTQITAVQMPMRRAVFLGIVSALPSEILPSVRPEIVPAPTSSNSGGRREFL